MKQFVQWKRLAMIALVAAVAFCQPVPVESQNRPFSGPIIRQFGTSARDHLSGISLNETGDLFMSGATWGDLGGVNQGGADIFLDHQQKSRSGGRHWVRQFGTEFTDDCDAASILHVAGRVYEVSSTPGSLFGPNGGGEDIVVAQYDEEGDLQWSEQLSRVGDQCHGGAQLAPTIEGGVYIPGATEGDLGGPSAGLVDAFLARYDRDGNVQWIRQMGSSGYDYAEAVAPDGSGGVYVTGYTNGSLGAPVAGFDAWLARFDSAGNQLWVRQFGTTGNDTASSISAVEHGRGGVYIGGKTTGSFGGPHVGAADGWVARFSKDGDLVWVRQLGTSGNEDVRWVTTSPGGGVYASGWTEGDLAGPSAGGRDIFVVKYNAPGVQVFSKQFGTSVWEGGVAMDFDPVGRILYVVGWTLGDLGGPNAGDQDAFIAEFHGLSP